jgi:hypothetical protein
MNQKIRVPLCLLTLSFLLAAGFVSSMEWPDAGAAMLSNFAAGKEPSLGYSFRSDGPVRSVASGEIIFIRDEADQISVLPPGLGTWLAIDHGDGLVGVYGHLNGGNNPYPYMVEQGSLIGLSGLSGWTGVSGFYFSFFDRREKRWVNPGMILPPLADTRPPLIRSVVLEDSQGQVFNLAQTRTLSQGQYLILVDSPDTRLGPQDDPLNPHRISCYVNGAEKGSVNFETLSARKGALLVSSSAGARDAAGVYAPYPALSVGEVFLSRGQTAVEIIVEDIAGNSRVASYRFLVE